MKFIEYNFEDQKNKWYVLSNISTQYLMYVFIFSVKIRLLYNVINYLYGYWLISVGADC